LAKNTVQWQALGNEVTR